MAYRARGRIQLHSKGYEMTLYIYSNDSGEQIDAINGCDNYDCEQQADEKYGSNDYHWSYVDQDISDAVQP